MDQVKKEFIRLFKQSGWSQAEAARQLEMTRGGINGIITGETSPHISTLKLFRYILAEQGLKTSAEPMHDRAEPAGEGETDLWKRRAKSAEQELAEIKDGLRALLDKSSSKPVSSAPEHTEHTGPKKVLMPEWDQAFDRVAKDELKKKNAGGSTPEPPAPPIPTKKIQ